MIARIDLYAYELTYVHGEYVMSGGRSITALSSTVAAVTTEDGLTGFGETCPLGSNYLPAHAAGARAALSELAPRLIGLDPQAVSAAMDAALLGHPYAKSALDVACWDVFARACGRPLCELLGGRRQARFPLYVAVPLGPPEAMAAFVQARRAEGVHRFQLKLGGAPLEDAARARAVVEATGDEDIIYGDANGGWRLRDALIAARAMADLPRFILEQPCPTLEECLRVGTPLILDEVITDLQSLLRAWESGRLLGINLKISRVGGLTPARVIRDVAQELGLTVNIEDSWGGDVVTAAVSHLAASTRPEALQMVSFMNDWTNEHVAGHEPRSVGGVGAAPAGPGLGIAVDVAALGEPFFSAP